MNLSATGFRDEAPRTGVAFCLSVLLHGLLAAALIGFFWRQAREVSRTTAPFEMVAPPSATDDSPAAAVQAPQTAPAKLQQLPLAKFPDEQKIAAPPQSAPPTPPQPVAQTPPQPARPAPPKPAVKTAPTPPVTTSPMASRAPSTQPKPAPAPPPKTESYGDFLKEHPAQAAPSSPSPAAIPAPPRPRPAITVGLSASAEVASLSKIAAGSGAGTAAGQSGAPSASQKSDYLGYLESRLLEAFTLPAGVSGLQAEVTITINAQGQVIKRVINTLSGNKEFDDAVRAAMNALTNVNPPPSGSTTSFNFTFKPSPS